MQTVVSNSIQPKRPGDKSKLSSDKLNEQLKNETNLAWHEVKIFCIKNCLWLIPLIILILSIVIVDLIAVFGVWKNPIILFDQIKKLAGYVIVYVLGLVTDHIRKMIIKN